MKITLDLLERLNACEEQRDLFAATFRDGCEVNAENALCAARARLDTDWLARRALKGAQRVAYDEAATLAWRAYDEAATAWRAYREATAAPRRAYDEAIAAARLAYDEATAITFVSIINGE